MTSTANPVMDKINMFFNTLDHKLEKPLKQHLSAVYSTLALCLLAAAVGAYIHVCTELLRGNWLTLIGSIALMLLLYATPATPQNEGLRFGYLMGFSALSGLATGPLLDVIIRIDPTIVATAFMGTCVIFGCFTLAALYAPDRKYLYLGGMLMSALSTMFWMGLFNLFFGSSLIFHMNLYMGLVVICMFVLYDTQMIMEKRRMGDNDYITHSLELFVDFLDIFRRLAIILAENKQGKKKKRDD